MFFCSESLIKNLLHGTFEIGRKKQKKKEKQAWKTGFKELAGAFLTLGPVPACLAAPRAREC